MAIKLASKEEILEHVEMNNCSWFENKEYISKSSLPRLEYNSPEYIRRYVDRILTEEEEAENEVYASAYVIDDYNEGDGNTAQQTHYFKPYDLYVSLYGVYSSWDRTIYDNVYVTTPYQHTETRYR